MSTERDRLVIEAILGDNINWTDGDTGSATDAILTHFQRKPRQVTTPEELAALPVGSVVLDRDGDSYQLKGEHWWLAGFGDDFDGHEIALPATVLHVGGAE